MGTEVERLLDKIQYSELVMPAFQREYVWVLEQSKELINSLFKQYPTGSLLFWETASPPELKNVNLTLSKGQRVTVILDGQQRLTTLYLFIRGELPPYYQQHEISHDPRHLYINLETSEFKYYQAREMDSNPLWQKVVDVFRKPPNPLELAIQRLQINDFSQALNKDVIGLQSIINENLNRLLSILKLDYPVQTVPDTATITEAIEVFDLVNSQGTKLTEAELALAHMTGKWSDCRSILKSKKEILKKQGFNFDLTFLVRCMTAIVTERAQYEQIHRRSKEELQDGWQKLNTVLDYLVNILPTYGYIHTTDDLASTNILVPVVSFLVKQGGYFRSAEERRSWLRWIYLAHLWSRYSSQADQRLDRDIGIALKSATPAQDLEKEIIQGSGRVKVQPGDFESRDIRHPVYRMMFVVAKSKGAVDWITGLSLSDVGVKSKQTDAYLFRWQNVRAKYENRTLIQKQKVNEIANRLILLDWPPYNLDTADTLEYLETIEAQYPGTLAAYAIPTNRNIWNLDHYEQFLQARRQLISDQINEFIDSFLPALPSVEEDLLSKIQAGESPILEFKESIRVNTYTGTILTNGQLSDLREKISCEVAAFMNADGGTLLIGVKDSSEVTGIQPDITTFPKASFDEYQLYISGFLKSHLGSENLPYINIRYEDINDMSVCVIEIDAAPHPVYVIRDSTQRDLYVRLGTSAQKLDAQAIVTYTKARWG